MQFENHSTNLEMALYASLSRVAWALALSYIIFACVHGYGGPVNWFLTLSLWQPLSRLSYSIYIIHFPVIVVVMASAKTSFYMSEFSAVRTQNHQRRYFHCYNNGGFSSFNWQYHYFLGNYVLSVLVAIVASLAFESPIVILEKMIFGSGKKREQHTELPPKQEEPNESV